MKQLATSYVFDAAAKTVTLNNFNFPLNHLLVIINATRQQIIYNLANPALGAANYTQGTNSVVTLEATLDSNTQNTDALTIFYDNGAQSDTVLVQGPAGPAGPAAPLTDTAPANLAATAAAGDSAEAARADHVHALPTPDSIGAAKAAYLPETQPTVRRIQVTASGTNRPTGLSEVTQLNFVGFFKGRPDYSTELGQAGDLGHTLLYWYDDLTQAGTTVSGMWVLDAYGDATSILVKPSIESSVLGLGGSGWYRSGISLALGEAFNGTVTIAEIPAQFGGANGTVAGTTGLVPQPAATDNTKYLKGDGTWATVSSTGGASLTNTVTPANLASAAAVGTSNEAARADHVHARPTAADIRALPDTIVVSGAGSTIVNGTYTKGSGSISTISGATGTLYEKSGAWIYFESGVGITRIGIINPNNGSYFYYRDYEPNLNVPSFVGGLTFNAMGSQGTGSFPNPLQIAHTHAISDTTGLQTALDGKASTANFGGTNGSTPGTAGLVPQPAATDNTKFLKGDGNWADAPSATPNSLSIGTVETGAAGSNASATIGGTAPSQTLSLAIPRGDKGDTGNAATVAVGTVTTGNAGSPASVTNSGTSSAATLNFTIPRGDAGTNGTAVLSGSGNPAGTLGAIGDFYINTSTNFIFGPKTSANSWPAGVSLVGAAGPAPAGTGLVSVTNGVLDTPQSAQTLGIMLRANVGSGTESYFERIGDAVSQSTGGGGEVHQIVIANDSRLRHRTPIFRVRKTSGNFNFPSGSGTALLFDNDPVINEGGIFLHDTSQNSKIRVSETGVYLVNTKINCGNYNYSGYAAIDFMITTGTVSNAAAVYERVVGMRTAANEGTADTILLNATSTIQVTSNPTWISVVWHRSAINNSAGQIQYFDGAAPFLEIIKIR